MFSRIITNWTILRICLEERLVYRGDFALGTLMRFLPIVTMVFLWEAIYDSSKSSTIAGYGRNEMIAYLLLTMISRAFSSMPGLASGIALQVRNGEIKKYLVQPIDMINFLLLSRVAHKLVYYVVAIGPFALVFFLFRGYFPGWPSALVMLAYIVALVQAFLLGFFLEATIGMIGFWFLEVSSLLFVYMLFSFFLSGHMFPITLLPGIWGQLVQVMPLQYLTYFPAAIFLEKLSPSEMITGLWIQAAWVVFFAIMCRVMFRLGLRRYSGFGG